MVQLCGIIGRGEKVSMVRVAVVGKRLAREKWADVADANEGADEQNIKSR